MAAEGTLRARVRAIALLRCPRCYEGRVFRGPLQMNEVCPVCGLKFTRETGYFLGAMYFSYTLGMILIALFMLLAYLIFPHWRLYQHFLLAWVAFLPLVPAVFRYSRVMWLHFDRYFDPDA
ncbi:MAG: DUF983 domain-containing protein [Isosphaeraceae bacterium]|nr:DUF983 domain-containing protein [Isosphaeraceae bacterium]